MPDLAVYVHVPFCARKCAYCDFNAYSGMGALAEPYVQALVAEIGRSPEAGRHVSSVFFGGGTPSHLSGEALAEILEAVRARFDLATDAEVTAEANPTCADAARFGAMRAAGFNRLSIGVQAFDDRLLRAVDREHSADDAEDAVRRARAAGFANVSIDLMFGLPGQSECDWETTLDRALALETEHISTYALTLEPGTRFERLHAGGKLALPGEDAELWMYERAIERLADAGFEHYEVSNFARPGLRARHNLVYWRNDEYLGFGAGAVSYLAGLRWTNEKLPSRYIARVRSAEDLAVESERLDAAGALAETLMQGLRLREGIPLAPLSEQFGIDPADRYAAVFTRLADDGLVEFGDGRVRLTNRGLLLANDVFVELLPE